MAELKTTITAINNDTIACGECGQLHRFRTPSPREVALCSRCSGVLYRYRRNMVPTVMALALTGLILFFISNFFPLLGLRAQGMTQELSLFQASLTFWQQDYSILALLILLNILVLPLFELLSLLWIMLTIRFRWRPNIAIVLFRWIREVKPWGMLEVFMLGTLVAVVKLGDLALLIIGSAFWSFSLLIVVMTTATVMLDPFFVWRELDACREQQDDRVSTNG